MTRMTATEARRQLFKLLDAVEQGEDVVLERGGVRFRLILEQGARSVAELPTSPLVIRDLEILEGEWTWKTDERGQLVLETREPST